MGAPRALIPPAPRVLVAIILGLAVVFPLAGVSLLVVLGSDLLLRRIRLKPRPA